MPWAPGLPAVEGFASAAARRSFRLQARSARLSTQVPLRLVTAATPRVPVSSLLGLASGGDCSARARLQESQPSPLWTEGSWQEG